MIRYSISQEELEEAIENEKRGWLERARQKTEAFREAQDFTEASGQNTWSEIKGAYMKLQSNKCAYCERILASEQFGKIEHDVEHYRPKNAVITWPTAKMREQRRYAYAFPTGEASDKGYYLLAYNPLNYLTACKTCNSALKSNYFPIAGERLTSIDDFEELKNEKPYLIYPVSDMDEDPEELITFKGILPVPTRRSGPRYRRARITITFFALDIRDELIKARATLIQIIWLAYDILKDDSSNNRRRAIAQNILDLALSSRSKHTNCARSFYRLCQQNPAQASQFLELAERILQES